MHISDDPDRTWDEIGKSDAYYGVLTDDRFRSGQLNDEAIAEFFRTGDDHIARTIATAEKHFGCRMGRGRAVDFGCGVGRLGIPMAGRFVDISPAYLSLTK